MGRRRRNAAASDAEWHLVEAADPSAPAPPSDTALPAGSSPAPVPAPAPSAPAPPAPSPSPASRFLRALPSELLPRILSLLPPNDLAGSVRLVCRDALHACHEALLMQHAALMPSVGATLPAPLCCCAAARTRPHHLAVPSGPCIAGSSGSGTASASAKTSNKRVRKEPQHGSNSSSKSCERCPLCPRFAIHLSQPVPPALFAWRWAPRAAIKGLDITEREQLWHLTVATGVLQNIRVLRCRTVWYGDPDARPTSADFTAAARSGNLELVRLLRRTGHREDRQAALQAAAAAGRTEVCYWLLSTRPAKTQWLPQRPSLLIRLDPEFSYNISKRRYCSRFTGWTKELPGLAAAGGHVALVQWLLQVHKAAEPHFDTGIRYNVDAQCVLVGAAAGFSVGALTSLYGTLTESPYRRCWYGVDRERTAHAVLLSAATSATPDWQAKAAWVLGELFKAFGPRAVPGRGHSKAAHAAGSGYSGDNSGSSSSGGSDSSCVTASPGVRWTPRSEVCTAVAALPGALPRLQWLQERGCPLDPQEVLQQVVCVSGDADMLTHLLQHHGVVPGPQDVQRAACLGHVEVLQVLLRNHPHGRGTADSAPKPGGGSGRGSGGEDEEMRDWFRRAVLSAAWCGQVHVLAWLARARRELLVQHPQPQQQQTGLGVAAGNSAVGSSSTGAAAAAVFPTVQEVLSAALWDDAIGCDPTQEPQADIWGRRIPRRAGRGRKHPPGLGLPNVGQGGEWWKFGSSGASGGGEGGTTGHQASVLGPEPPFHMHPLYVLLQNRRWQEQLGGHEQRQQQLQRLALLRQTPEQRVLRTLLWLRQEGTWWPGAPGEVLLQRTWRAPKAAVEWLRAQGVRALWWYEAGRSAGGSNSGSEGDEHDGNDPWDECSDSSYQEYMMYVRERKREQKQKREWEQERLVQEQQELGGLWCVDGGREARGERWGLRRWREQGRRRGAVRRAERWWRRLGEEGRGGREGEEGEVGEGTGEGQHVACRGGRERWDEEEGRRGKGAWDGGWEGDEEQVGGGDGEADGEGGLGESREDRRAAVTLGEQVDVEGLTQQAVGDSSPVSVVDGGGYGQAEGGSCDAGEEESGLEPGQMGEEACDAWCEGLRREEAAGRLLAVQWRRAREHKGRGRGGAAAKGKGRGRGWGARRGRWAAWAEGCVRRGAEDEGAGAGWRWCEWDEGEGEEGW